MQKVDVRDGKTTNRQIPKQSGEAIVINKIDIWIRMDKVTT